MLDKKGNLVRNLCKSHYCSGDNKEITDDEYRDFRMEDFLIACVSMDEWVGFGEFGVMIEGMTSFQWQGLKDDAKKWSERAYGRGWDNELDDFHTRFLYEREWEKLLHKGDDPRGTPDGLIYVVYYDDGEVIKLRHDQHFWVDRRPAPIPEKSIYIMRTNGVSGGTDGKLKQYKIGVAKNVEQRRKSIQTSNANEIEVIFEMETVEHSFAEKQCHLLFESYRTRTGGGKEWFTMDERQMDLFLEYVDERRKRGASLLDIIVDVTKIEKVWNFSKVV